MKSGAIFHKSKKNIPKDFTPSEELAKATTVIYDVFSAELSTPRVTAAFYGYALIIITC